jgi:putative tryptophan/tyrosine transport system substrate-binding protein
VAPDRPRRSRRRFQGSSLALAGFGLLGGCDRVLPLADRSPRMPRVGYLLGGAGQESAATFQQALAERGYVEGRTVSLEWRNPEGRLERYSDFAAELVRLPVDVFVADGNSAVRAAMQATGTIPIVMAQSSSPVEQGLVASLARPGGNVTGLSGISRELIGKRLELLKATIPGLVRVGVLWNPGIADRAGDFEVAEAAAGPLGLDLRSFEALEPAELDSSLERALSDGVTALFLLDNIVLTSNPARVGAFALRHRLPMMSSNRSFVVAGGLMAYGLNRPGLYRRTAAYVDKILKGARPGDLPVEQPTTFDFVINAKSAQALHLTINPSLLAQVTEVIS